MSNEPTYDGQELQAKTKKPPIGSVEPIFCKIAAQLEALGYYTQSDRTKPRKMMAAILHGLDAAYWVGVGDATKLREENNELKAWIANAIQILRNSDHAMWDCLDDLAWTNDFIAVLEGKEHKLAAVPELDKEDRM